MLPDLARRRALAWRLLRRRKERRLLGAIGLSSWVSGDGAGVIWWSLMRRRGFWQLLARVGFDGEEERLRELSADAGCSGGSGLCCGMPRDARKVFKGLGIAVVVVGCVGNGLPVMGSRGGLRMAAVRGGSGGGLGCEARCWECSGEAEVLRNFWIAPLLSGSLRRRKNRGKWPSMSSVLGSSSTAKV